MKETDYKMLFCCFLEKVWTVEKASISIPAKIKEDFCNAKKEQSRRNIMLFMFFRQCLQLGACPLNPPSLTTRAAKSPLCWVSILFWIWSVFLCVSLCNTAAGVKRLDDYLAACPQKNMTCLSSISCLSVLLLNSILFHTSSAVGKSGQIKFSIFQQHKNPGTPS